MVFDLLDLMLSNLRLDLIAGDLISEMGLYTYDQVMEHHDWFDGSDERGEPAYFLPTNVKKAMSSAAPTEKQLNANLYACIKHEVLAASQQRIREVGSHQPEANMRFNVPMAAYTTQSSQVGTTSN